MQKLLIFKEKNFLIFFLSHFYKILGLYGRYFLKLTGGKKISY